MDRVVSISPANAKSSYLLRPATTTLHADLDAGNVETLS